MQITHYDVLEFLHVFQLRYVVLELRYVVLELRYVVLRLRFPRFSTGIKRHSNGLLDLSFCWVTITSIFSDFYSDVIIEFEKN